MWSNEPTQEQHVGKKMFSHGKNAGMNKLVRPQTQGQDNNDPKVPKVEIDIVNTSIVDVFSGDPFRQSYQKKSSRRENSVNAVHKNFNTDPDENKTKLQEAKHTGISIIWIF